MFDRSNPPLGALMTQIVESEGEFMARERSRLESQYFDKRLPKQKQKKPPYEQRVRARLAQKKVAQ